MARAQGSPDVFHPSASLRGVAQNMRTADLIRFKEDFLQYNSTFNWAMAEQGTAVDAITDAHGGVLSLASAGGANEEGMLSTIAESWLFQAAKRASFEARFSCTEATTDDAAFIFGLSDTVAADTIVDGGLTLATSFDGAVIFKAYNTMTLWGQTSNATVQSTAVEVCPFTSAVNYRIGFDFDPNDGVTGKVTFWAFNETTGLRYITAAQNLTISGLAEMHAFFGVKNVAAVAETILVDYIEVLAER